jgi:hypothetical protein
MNEEEVKHDDEVASYLDKQPPNFEEYSSD